MQVIREKHTRGTPDFPFQIYRHEVEKSGTVTVRFHFHAEIEIIFIKKGSINLNVMSEEFIFKAGDICFINPEEPHTITTSEDDTYYEAAVFSPTLINFNVSHFFNEQFVTPLLKGELSLPRVISLKDFVSVREIFSSNSKPVILSQLIMLFSLFLENSLIRKNRNISGSKHSHDIKNITEYIGEHFVERLSLSTLAEKLHFSENYFCSYFKKYTGMTVFEYINHIRIQKACELLKETENSVSEIAEACGFESASFFIRKFKKIRGCTPRQYKKTVYDAL